MKAFVNKKTSGLTWLCINSMNPTLLDLTIDSANTYYFQAQFTRHSNPTNLTMILKLIALVFFIQSCSASIYSSVWCHGSHQGNLLWGIDNKTVRREGICFDHIFHETKWFEFFFQKVFSEWKSYIWIMSVGNIVCKCSFIQIEIKKICYCWLDTYKTKKDIWRFI